MPQVTIEKVAQDGNDVLVTLEIDGAQITVAIPHPEEDVLDTYNEQNHPIYLNLVFGGNHYI